MVVCLAPEIDRKYEKVYAYLQDDATRRKPGVDLVLNLLCQSPSERLEARAAFNPNAALFKFRILQMTDGADGPAPLISRSLKLDDRIANALLGQKQMDARLEPFARLVLPRESSPGMIAAYELYRQTKAFLKAFFSERRSGGRSMGRNVALYLHGPANADRRLIVEAICNDFGLALIVADVAQMKAGQLPFDEAVPLLVREAGLQSSALLLENADCLIEEPEGRLAELSSALESRKDFLAADLHDGKPPLAAATSRAGMPVFVDCGARAGAWPLQALLGTEPRCERARGGRCRQRGPRRRVPIWSGPDSRRLAGGGDSGSLAFSRELADHGCRSVGRLPRAIEPQAGRARSQDRAEAHVERHRAAARHAGAAQGALRAGAAPAPRLWRVGF